MTSFHRRGPGAVMRLMGAAVACAAALLAGCGGSSLSDLAGVGSGGSGILAGVGSGGSGIATGLVTGFGSVIIDGIEYDDSSATRQTEDATGVLRNAAVKLGQRVLIRYSGTNLAQTIEVRPQLIGPVSKAPGADGTLLVMGQNVRLVTSSANSSQSAPTALEGYGKVAEIAAGDDVEVHGSWVYDAALFANVLVATRVEKLQAPADPVQLGGVVMAVSGNLLRINAAGGLAVSVASLPALEQGNVVRIWAARSALALAPVPAARVVNTAIDAGELASRGAGSISGLISEFDPATRSLSIEGVKVNLADAAGMDAGALAPGQFAVVQLGASGSTMMRANAVLMRAGGNASDLGRTSVVSAVTRNIDWTRSSVAFSLRGIDIVAEAAAISDSCRSVLANRDFVVTVRGALTQPAAALTASQITCSQAVAVKMTADYSGTITAVGTAARSLTIAADGTAGTIAGNWDSNTFFNRDPASLSAGMRISMEGVIEGSANSLRLTRVRALP